MTPYCETLPPLQHVFDCNNPSTSACNGTHSIVGAIACSALAQSALLTVTYNTCELTADGGVFNTEVVVRNGSFVAKYRKFNVFYKKCFDSPALELVTFHVTSRNNSRTERFGIFTCYDILWPHPKDDLVKRGVKYFNFASAIPLIATAAVQAFSWLSGSVVVNANAQTGQSAVIQKGSVLAKCTSGSTCVALAQV